MPMNKGSGRRPRAGGVPRGRGAPPAAGSPGGSPRGRPTTESPIARAPAMPGKNTSGRVGVSPTRKRPTPNPRRGS